MSALKACGSTRPEVGAWENDVLLHRLLAMAQGYPKTGATSGRRWTFTGFLRRGTRRPPSWNPAFARVLGLGVQTAGDPQRLDELMLAEAPKDEEHAHGGMPGGGGMGGMEM
jgi:hypothetical protein